MSLHKFAEQVAAHGRGDDSLLVHMTPDEVQRLQKFAEANGRSLTINPHTGLPEAGFLSDLFKAVAPIALGAFLGPAGFGMSAAMAGVATGGITALATGSLSRGLMAGLGAYGGAGLGGALSGAGESALASQGANLGTALTDTQAQSLGFQNAGTAAQTNALATAPIDKLSAGFNAATASPTAAMDFAKANYKPLLAAAAPIMAGSMVPTTTPLGTPKSDNYIRQFDFNINPETGKPDPLYGVRAMTPVKASEFGGKTLQGQRELFRQQNPNPYELGVGSLNQPPQQEPKPMATGGIVALAGGGGLDTNSDIYKYFADPATQSLLSSGNDAAIAAKMQEKDWTPAQIAAATGTQGQQADYERRFVQAIDKPDTSAAEFMAATKDVGLQNQALANAMQNAGMSQAAQYASTHGLSDVGGIKGTNFYTNIGYTPGAQPGDQGGLEGLYANINYAAQGLQNQIAAGNMTGQQAREAAFNEMNRIGMSTADLKAATGKTLAELFPDTKVKPPVVLPPPVTVTPGGTQLPGATVYDNGAFGNYGSGPATGVDYLGRTVSIATPGDIITNPDQTRTVVPNIPGRPYGGFTGIDELKSKYTAGGGSLGYTAPAPRTMADFEKLYNKQTGDSLAAYNYLMGKGANNNAYPVKSGVSQVSVPYAEYVLGKKTTGLKPATATVKPVVGIPGQPQTYFDEAGYLAANPDVAAELKSGKAKFANAYEHYLMYGQKEGRPFKGDYQGYLTATALASAPQQGGESPSGPSGNTGNTISGFTPAPPNNSIPVADMGIASPGTAASAADGAAAAAASASGTAPGSDGSPGSGAKRGGLMHYAMGGGLGSLGSYSDGGRLLKGPGDGVSDSIPATIGQKQQPARLADGEFVVPARIVSELGNGSTEAGAKKLYAMMDRVQRARGKTTGKNKVAANSRADKYLPA